MQGVIMIGVKLNIVLLLMRSGEVREKYTQQIRKMQREEIKASMRSKLLRGNPNAVRMNGEEMMEKEGDDEQIKLQFLNQIVSHKQKDFFKIKQLLRLIARQYNLQKQSQSSKNIIKHILTLQDNSCFILVLTEQNAEVRQLRITLHQLKQCLQMLSQLLCTLIKSININISKLKNLSKYSMNSIQVYLFSLQKIQQCKYISEINTNCNCFIEQYSRMLEDIECHYHNQSIIQLITEALIQSTCFKPRQIVGHPQAQHLVDRVANVNREMLHIQQIVNTQICNSLIPVISDFKLQEKYIKLFINYIYIIGNVFVSLTKSKHPKQAKRYQEMQQIVRNQLSSNITQLITMSKDPTKRLMLFSNTSWLLQLASVSIWFIRNEILIYGGMFNEDRVMHADIGQIVGIANQYWVKIVLDLFCMIQGMYQYQGQNQKQVYSKQYVEVVVDGLALIQVIQNDLGIDQGSIKNIMFHYNWFKLRVNYNVQYQREIFGKIYDFYLGLTCSRKLSKEWMGQILTEAYNICIGNIVCSNGFIFCGKVISNCKVDRSQRCKLFMAICNNADRLLELVVLSDRYDQQTGILNLLHSTFCQEQLFSQFQTNLLQILTPNSTKNILLLSSKIWQSDTSASDITLTLQLLKLLSSIPQLIQQLKLPIQSVGYYCQLQMLSEHRDEDINRLVYEIFQLLDLQ